MADILDVNQYKTTQDTVGGKQYIVVKLGNEQYGIDIGYVENIVRMQRITRVPKAQNYFKGVINLRGDVVPVMSLRTKFGLHVDDYSMTTRIIILKLENALVGIIVDEVKEIVYLCDEDIELPSFNVKDEKVNYLIGVGKLEQVLISVLNIPNLIITEKDGDK